MGQRFRFAIISDPHITLPHTLYDSPQRFHLVEVSIPSFEQILDHLETLNLDFLLLPGDLTQHGEWENHRWLVDRLKQLPFPSYVVPGNHDIIQRDASDRAIGLADFPALYQDFGYSDGQTPYYSQEILPGVRLMGLNSNAFDGAGAQISSGHLDLEQLVWLDETLAAFQDELLLVMLHHNVLEHLYGQSKSSMGQRYMVSNRHDLIRRVENRVPLMFTGHLHVQNVARHGSLHEVLTGSLVSYPHPYRVVEIEQSGGELTVQIESHRVAAVPDWPDLQGTSFDWMCDRAIPFMTKLLTSPPVDLPLAQAQAIAPKLKHFWATIADGDPQFDFSHLPPEARRFLDNFSAVDDQGNPEAIDNHTTLRLTYGPGKTAMSL
ncbi:metallophosphoesterase [filamentous cyanobacterium CCP5]|nr:metallophosphoesterase [filamentous cyanobacterium CCP5]